MTGHGAELTVETDRPLKNGMLEMDDGSHISSRSPPAGDNADRQGAHPEGWPVSLRGTEQGENVRLSEDYFIEARSDDAPTVQDHASRLGCEGQPDRGSDGDRRKPTTTSRCRAWICTTR